MKGLIGTLVIVFASNALIAQKDGKTIYETFIYLELNQEKMDAVVQMAYVYLFDRESNIEPFFSHDYLTEENIFEASELDEQSYGIVYYLDKKPLKRQVSIYINVDQTGIYMLISKSGFERRARKKNSPDSYKEKFKYMFFSGI